MPELRKRLRKLEAENRKLKRLVADQRRTLAAAKKRSKPSLLGVHLHTRDADPLVLQVQRWLRRHFREDLRITEVARQFGVTTRKLRRLFQAATGETLITYLQWLRVEHARKLLARPRLAIADVVRRSGYDNVSVFSELFKRYTGETPAAYRKRGQHG
jgi:transcriptional regulator GlxA family with amidase domain